MGLQIPPGVDYEVPVLGFGRGRRAAGQRALAGDRSESGDLRWAINRDHVHLLVSIPPQVSVSRAVQFLKGKSPHRPLSEFTAFRKRYWGQHLWARGYWVASSGNVTDEVWQKYIENQVPEEPDDNFKSGESVGRPLADGRPA